MNELLDRLKLTRWWTILKALPFDDGPSSTRWVYLGAFTVVSLVLAALVGAIVVVYVRSPDHHVDVALCGLVGVQLTALLGFASNTQNTLHKLGASTPQTPPPQS